MINTNDMKRKANSEQRCDNATYQPNADDELHRIDGIDAVEIEVKHLIVLVDQTTEQLNKHADM
jgi:hypothetical protein